MINYAWLPRMYNPLPPPLCSLLCLPYWQGRPERLLTSAQDLEGSCQTGEIEGSFFLAWSLGRVVHGGSLFAAVPLIVVSWYL